MCPLLLSHPNNWKATETRERWRKWPKVVSFTPPGKDTVEFSRLNVPKLGKSDFPSLVGDHIPDAKTWKLWQIYFFPSLMIMYPWGHIEQGLGSLTSYTGKLTLIFPSHMGIVLANHWRLRIRHLSFMKCLLHLYVITACIRVVVEQCFDHIKTSLCHREKIINCTCKSYKSGRCLLSISNPALQYSRLEGIVMLQ